MLDLDTIKKMNKETAIAAKRNKVNLKEYSGENATEYAKSIPNIGNLRPKGYTLTDTFIVDSSGCGASNEPAMTFSHFIKVIKKGFCYAIIEAGQFQVYIGEFEPDWPEKVEPFTIPEGGII